MNYSVFQKFLSYLLIFALLFGITFRFPIPEWTTEASSNEVFDLVSIIVDEETFSRLESEIRRYGRDISNVLENTKVAIIPIGINSSPFQIASINESLFFEGYKSLSNVSFESKLIGTVFVGNIPIPSVYRNSEVGRTILPYTDFIDKSYIYNGENYRYEYNTNNISAIKPEIWHSFISPNTGEMDDDIIALRQYFQKNHDYYGDSGFYSSEYNSLNGDPNTPLGDNYEPYVFYYDSIRESNFLNYNLYLAYMEGYIPNKEDIIYDRYTSQFAQKLKEEFEAYSTDEIYSLIKKVDPNFEMPITEEQSWENIPDVQSRYVINNLIKRFIEIFASGGIGELRENVYNAGRYNYGNNVNVDLIPYLLSVLDVSNDELIKEFNSDLENEIDKIVKEGLSRKIAVPTTYTYTSRVLDEKYVNYQYGKKVENMSEANECTIYRGSTENSGQLVELNRGYNTLTSEADINTLKGLGTECLSNVMSGRSLEGLWGRNTMLNFDENAIGGSGYLTLKSRDTAGAIVPLYDIKAGQKSTDSTKIPSPLNCFNNNYLLSEEYACNSNGISDTCNKRLTYRLPTSNNLGAVGWTCMTDTNARTYDFDTSFEDNYNNLKALKCERLSITLDGKKVKEDNYEERCWTVSQGGGGGGQGGGGGGALEECECSADEVGNPDRWITKVWNYKSLESYIEHKSPRVEEFNAQVDAMTSPSLPVDKNRYIDFVGVDSNYKRIDYPHLFRLEIEDKGTMTQESVGLALDKYLDEISTNINNTIETSKLESISEEVDEMLSSGTYPNSDFDLKNYLKSKGSQSITIGGESKTLNSYDILVFALYWNNLNSVSAKYKFIFENYLSSQAGNENNVYLPENKSQYEIAYLGAEGDSQNMFIGLDPENKGDNPYSDIIAKNIDFSTKQLGINLNSGLGAEDDEANMQCGSPEGVPIWEWLPAIMCRLQDMMPPTIYIGEAKCGPSMLDLLDEEEKEEYKTCNGDFDKNGVNDCTQNNLKTGRLVLETDSSKHPYNSNIPLNLSVVSEDGKVIPFLNYIDVEFELVRLEELRDNGIYTIYDINIPEYNNPQLWTKYITYNDGNVRLVNGKASYSLTSKNKDVNAYFRAKISQNDSQNNNVASLLSDTLGIEIRGDQMFIGSHKIDSNENSFSYYKGINASENTNLYIIDTNNTNFDSVRNLVENNSLSKNKLVMSINNLTKSGDSLALAYPLKLKVENENGSFNEELTLNSITNFSPLFALNKSGNYRVTITDSLGVSNTSNFIVYADSPEYIDISLGSTVLESAGGVTTNYMTILDRFGNVVSGEQYDIEMALSGDSVEFFDNGNTTLNTNTFEGYKIFRLKSTSTPGNAILNVGVSDSEGNRLLDETKSIEVISDYNVSFSPLTEVHVGGGNYKMLVEIKNRNGELIRNLNSRVYMYATSNYIDLDTSYFDLSGGRGEISFTTKTIAGREIPIELQVEGLSQIVKGSLTILPDVPMKIDLALSKTKMEASLEEYSILELELKDRYNNVVFNNSSTRLNLEILPEYSHIITSGTTSQTVNSGKASFRLYGTLNPGIAYFKISSNPSLENNSFSYEKASENISVNGVSENAGKIETFYLWNKDRIDNMQYNAIYTTLIGASYGDIEEENYLAGAIVFNPNSKALAATSILGNPYYYNNIFSLSKGGALEELYSSLDLSQDIDMNVLLDNGNILLDIFNISLNSHIGKIYYNTPSKVSLKLCESDIASCKDNSNTSIIGKNTNSNYNFYIENGNLVLLDNTGNSLLEVNSSGKISKKSNIVFEVLSNSENHLLLGLHLGDDIVGELALNFVDASINITRDESVLKNKITSSSNAIFMYLDSSLYAYNIIGKGDSKKVILYYNDPLAEEDRLNTFTSTQNSSYEDFKDASGVGWSNSNKTLLSFASGKNVGESLKDFASFSSINIGDPVVSLKKIKKKFASDNKEKQFDSTIGDIISNDVRLEGYRLLDYNNDTLKDILLIKNDGYMQLLENRNIGSRFLDLGDLAFVVDIGKLDSIKTGDFSGDGYDDIFFIGDDNLPYLLNNVNKNFSRLSLDNKLDINGRVLEAEVFDMDTDGIDDIVILDDFGEINVFYGGGSSANPIFTKQYIGAGYGLELSDNVFTDGALVYFNGFHQLGDTDNNTLIEESMKALENYETAGLSNAGIINYDLINSYLFEQIPYGQEEYTLNSLSGAIDYPDSAGTRTFVKSEYSQVVGLAVEKKIIDENSGLAIYGDKIGIEITLTNNSSRTLSDIVYLENVYDAIELDETSFSNSGELEFSDGLGSYDFMLDNFSLRPRESIIINYFGTLKKTSYLDIEAGVFDNSNNYGDVLVKTNEENCRQDLDMYKSVNIRQYEKTLYKAQCDNTPLPDELAKNTVDSDENGVPDYIDNLLTDTSASQEYADEQLSIIKGGSNSNSKSKNDDKFRLSDEITLDLGSLGAELESSLGEVQNFMNSLSCGFNNGACFSTPLNWAPLAPGGDPTFMGFPIGDGLRVNEGIPIFSSITGIPIPVGAGTMCVPTVRPMSPLGYMPTPTCGLPSAGGILGTLNPFNQIRIFVTPTLTGGVGTAICMGGPASVYGYMSAPPGLHPIVPGGNCVVVAAPILGCSNDGSEGDPSSLGPTTLSPSGGYSLINANCSNPNGDANYVSSNMSLSNDYVRNYIEHLEGQRTASSVGDYKGAIEDHSTFRGETLFSINGTGTPIEVTFDTDSSSFNFSDIKEIIEKRVNAFPAFLMNWVTAQIEEIVTKLVDFPTIFIIMPDMSGIYDARLTWDENKDKWRDDYRGTTPIRVSANSRTSSGSVLGTVQETIEPWSTGIKEAYEFIGSFPLVNIEDESVNISFPWISETELDRAQADRKMTLDLRREELYEAINSWSFGTTCSNLEDSGEKEVCEEQNHIMEKVKLDSEGLIRSLETNIEVLEEYADIPDKINELINAREMYLEQIICNIEGVSEITGGWIGRNGQIFKSWIELYILVRAILKSWQLLIDIFIDYEEGCKDCKNERQDLMSFIYTLISMIIPDIPVIRFPKWPDIVLDLHNIRAGLDISLPSFNFKPRPITLPPLPSLDLPRTPNAGIHIPELPILPRLEIPDLPELPSLPTIELPDLPPAPALPNILGMFTFILDIGRLVTKAMCILKSSPLVPEWRAGDQIAFLTERNGYLPTDFIDLNIPDIVLPFLDAIKVTPYVNLEFEFEQIIESARQMATPINTMSSDFTNMMRISVGGVDLSGETPSDINVDIENDGTIESDVQSQIVKGVLSFVNSIGTRIGELSKENKEVEDNSKFKRDMLALLGREDLTSDSSFNEMRDLWVRVNEYNFEEEDLLIGKLQNDNREKFNLVTDIINTEIVNNKKLKEEINEFFRSSTIKMSEKTSNVENYNTMLQKYNKANYNAYRNIVLGKDDNNELVKYGEEIIEHSNNLLVANTINTDTPLNIEQNTTNGDAVCTANGNSEYGYNYEGIYIIEDSKSYRLFDYKKELMGDEVTESVDIDMDRDDDILYMMNGTLYLKENLDNKDEKIYLDEEPLILNPSNNKFLSSSFVPSVNNLKTHVVANSILNISFEGLYNTNNYRLSYYNIIDKFFNEKNSSYTPRFAKRDIIDSISGIGTVNISNETALYDERKDIAYIYSIGDTRDVVLTTGELKNIREDLEKGIAVTIGNGTVVYAGENTTTLKYIDSITGSEKGLIIPSHRHIVMKGSINISGIIGNAYIATGEDIVYEGSDIKYAVGKPLSLGTSIKYIGNDFETREDAFIDMAFYDDTETSINFNYDKSWLLYDLGNYTPNSYSIGVQVDNDFYYARVNAFKNGIIGTQSNQVLIAPQNRADTLSTELDLRSIRIPVYQNVEVDLLQYIYEESGIRDLYIDFDLGVDSDSNGNPKDDNDSESMEKLNIILSDGKVAVSFDRFEELVNKKIGVNIIDNNGNKRIHELQFVVYSPNPQILGLDNNEFFGQINEELDEEPINIYRYRGGMISRLETEEGQTSVLTNSGAYNFLAHDNKEGLSIEKNGDVIALINERTGKITLPREGYNIRVLESNNPYNNSSYPQISVYDGVEDVYYESIRVNTNKPIEIVSDFDSVGVNSESGIYFIMQNASGYRYELTPPNAPHNPGSLIIYRDGTDSGEELFVIMRDGRINTLNDKYALRYEVYSDYIVFSLMDLHFNRSVGKVLFKVNSEYVIQ